MNLIYQTNVVGRIVLLRIRHKMLKPLLFNSLDNLSHSTIAMKFAALRGRGVYLICVKDQYDNIY